MRTLKVVDLGTTSFQKDKNCFFENLAYGKKKGKKKFDML